MLSALRHLTLDEVFKLLKSILVALVSDTISEAIFWVLKKLNLLSSVFDEVLDSFFYNF